VTKSQNLTKFQDDRDVEDMEDDVDKKKLTSNVVEGQ